MQKYNLMDQQLHLLSQVIAKVNRTYVPKKEDDSHTNLFFDSIDNRIYGRWIWAGKDKLVFSLQLDSQQFQWLDNKLEILANIHTIGKTIEEIETAIEQNLPVLGLDPAGFRDKLHFEIPSYLFAGKPMKKFNAEALQIWRTYRTLANDACAALLGHLQMEGETRIWPHHFDTGIYVMPNPYIGIGFGLAMKDSMVGKPYFYLSGYVLKGSLTFENLPVLSYGKWEVGEHWKGAVLSLDLLKNTDIDNKYIILNDFLRNTVAWFLKSKR